MSCNQNKTNIMNLYLTQKQEDTIYSEIMNIFEITKGECTNCESNYITDNRNYFYMMTEQETFIVEFNTKKGKLLKRSITIKAN